jgi:hypothetical protein
LTKKEEYVPAEKPFAVQELGKVQSRKGIKSWNILHEYFNRLPQKTIIQQS